MCLSSQNLSTQRSKLDKRCFLSNDSIRRHESSLGRLTLSVHGCRKGGLPDPALGVPHPSSTSPASGGTHALGGPKNTLCPTQLDTIANLHQRPPARLF